MFDHHWIRVIAAIEIAFVLSLVVAIRTRRTKMVFAMGFNVMAPVVTLHLWRAAPLDVRATLAALMAGVYLGSLNWVILLWTRDTALSKLDASLRSKGLIGLAFVLSHTVGLGYCLPFYYVGRDGSPLGGWDFVALGIYAAGTFLHVGGDYQKRAFKRQPGARGRLLDTGLWSWSRHPNYFGDFLVYVSFALLARHPLAWLCPLLNLLQYLFDAIPKNERWAAEKYGEAWDRYRRTTPMFLPRPRR